MPISSDLNTTADKENVVGIKRNIWVIKEQARVIWSFLTFNKVPGSITIKLIVFVILWLNDFQPARRASQTYIPHTIVNEQMLELRKNCRFDFGS